MPRTGPLNIKAGSYSKETMIIKHESHKPDIVCKISSNNM